MFLILYQYECSMFNGRSQWSALPAVIRLELFFASLVVLLCARRVSAVAHGVFDPAAALLILVTSPLTRLRVCALPFRPPPAEPVRLTPIEPLSGASPPRRDDESTNSRHSTTATSEAP